MSLNYTEIADINDIINDEISFWAYPLRARSLSFAMPQIKLVEFYGKSSFPQIQYLNS